jgi:hypothetical protein
MQTLTRLHKGAEAENIRIFFHGFTIVSCKKSKIDFVFSLKLFCGR